MVNADTSNRSRSPGTEQHTSGPTNGAFFIVIFGAWLGSIRMGTRLGYSSPAIPSLRKGNVTGSFTVTTDEETWFGSLMTIGTLVGGLGTGFFVDILGRRRSLVLSSVGCTTDWVLIGTAKNAIALCAGRVVAGMFIGLVWLVVPLYVSEVSLPQVWGILSSGIQLSVTVDILGVFLVGKYVRRDALHSYA